MQLASHIRYSKSSPLALMRAVNHLVRLRMDLSMGSCLRQVIPDRLATIHSCVNYAVCTGAPPC